MVGGRPKSPLRGQRVGEVRTRRPSGKGIRLDNGQKDQRANEKLSSGGGPAAHGGKKVP